MKTPASFIAAPCLEPGRAVADSDRSACQEGLCIRMRSADEPADWHEARSAQQARSSRAAARPQTAPRHTGRRGPGACATRPAAAARPCAAWPACLETPRPRRARARAGRRRPPAARATRRPASATHGRRVGTNLPSASVPSSWLKHPHMVVGALSVFRSGHAILLLQVKGTRMGHLRDLT